MQRFSGLLFGLLEMSLVKFYQYVVDPAPPGSWPVRLFRRLARGPLRRARALVAGSGRVRAVQADRGRPSHARCCSRERLCAAMWRRARTAPYWQAVGL